LLSSGKNTFEKFSWISSVTLTAVLLGALALLGSYRYLAFHSIAELFSIIVAVAIFVIAWNARDSIENGYLYFLGIALLFVAAIDLAHMLTFKGMGAFPEYDTDLPTQLWIAGRALESVSLLVAPVFLKRRLRPRVVFSSYTAVTAFVFASTFGWKIFPSCYIEGSGLTQFKITAEYVICFSLLLSLCGLLMNRRSFPKPILLLLCGSILTTILSELAFTNYVSVYGNSNLIGHLLKVLSVVFIYKAIVETGLRRPYELLYRSLAESESKFRSAIESNMIGVVFADPISGAITEANDEYLRIIGRTRSELKTGKLNWKSITPAEDLTREESEIRALDPGKRLLPSFEKEYLRPDGTHTPVIIGGAFLDDAQRKVVAFVLDNTARKNAEQALRQSEQRYRSFVEASSQIVWTTDSRGEVNLDIPAWQAYTGQTAEQARGFGWMDAIHPEDCAKVAVAWRNASESRGIYEVEYRLHRHDGMWRNILARGVPVFTVSGQLQEYVGTCIDITERRNAEEQLQKAHDDLEQKVLERTDELQRANRNLRMISECNEILVRAKNEQGLMQDICQAIVEAGGYQMAWVGYAENNDEKSVLPAASMGIEEGYLKSARISWAENELGSSPTGVCIRTGEICIGSNFIEDSRLAPWREEALKRGYKSSVALPLKIDGKTFGAISIYAQEPYAFDKGSDLMRELAEDLAFGIRSLRMQAERDRARQIAETRAGQLQALAAELVKTEQKERRQLAKILHDHLQQLLVAAKMNTSVIRAKAGTKDIQDIADSLTEMLDESIRASRSLTADLSPPILHEKGLAAALEWLRRKMQEKHGLSMEIDADPAAEPSADLVRIFLFEAVRELLLNAVKHAKIDRVQVRMRMLESGEIELIVADKGAGFDPTKIEATHSTSGGFGLFSIRERLNYLGGQMHIDAAPGQGSRFILTAPVCLPSESTESKTLEKATSLSDSKIRVLIVDDHKVVRHGLTKVLEEQPDIEVIGEAGKGYEAVALARQLRPDVVLMDIGLPDMSGLDATKLIRSSCPDVSVIGLSMHEENDMAASMIQAGAVAYQTKGGATESLISAIRANRSKKITQKPSFA
jgi:PAS domain S-box-containing protein